MNKAERLAISVVEAFEDLLDKKNLEIPCADHCEEEERHDNNNSAKIYGTEYGDLIDRVEALLKKEMKNDV